MRTLLAVLAVVLLAGGVVRADRPVGSEVNADTAATRAIDDALVRPGAFAVLDRVVILRGADSTDLAVGRPFTRDVVESLIDSVLDELVDGGYYYASVTIDKIVNYGNNINLYINEVPGPAVRIAALRYLGLRRVSPATVERWLPDLIGDTLTNRSIARLESAARDVPFVRFRPPVEIRPRPGYTETDLELNFQEERAVALELGGGYVPDDREDAFLWHVDARFNNVLGGGRRAGVLSERREIDRQILRINYSQPAYLLGLGEVRAGVATRDYRESFYEFAASVGYDTRLRPGLTVGAELGLRRVDPADDWKSYRAYQVSFTARWDRVEDEMNPSGGFRLGTSIGYAHRRYEQDSAAASGVNLNETRTSLDARIFQPVVGHLIVHLGAAYRGLETGEDLPPLSELVLIGGPGTIRGYRNEQFAVLRAAMFTFEPRLRYNSGYLFAFLDGAYLNNRVQTATGVGTDEDFRTGFGLGLAVVNDRRAVRLSLGWNPDLAYDQPRLSIEFSSEI